LASGYDSRSFLSAESLCRIVIRFSKIGISTIYKGLITKVASIHNVNYLQQEQSSL
jgi:hypothetical protein